MKIEHVYGVNKGKIFLYALSTCVWCKKTKKFLDELGVEYSYLFVDLSNNGGRDKITKEVAKWTPRCSYPTLVIKNKDVIVGFQEDKIREALDYE